MPGSTHSVSLADVLWCRCRAQAQGSMSELPDPPCPGRGRTSGLPQVFLLAEGSMVTAGTSEEVQAAAQATHAVRLLLESNHSLDVNSRLAGDTYVRLCSCHDR